MNCNSLLTKQEIVCLECGTKVGEEEAGSAGFISGIVSLLFYASLLVLVAAPFVDQLPSLMFCMFITSALLFMMRTAKDSAQKVKKR